MPSTQSMLHIVNKSPFEKNSLDSCLRLARAGARVLLIEDGVYAALADGAIASRVRTAMRDKKFYALDADLKARGIDARRLVDGVEVVGYDGFVELAAQSDKVQSWL